MLSGVFTYHHAREKAKRKQVDTLSAFAPVDHTGHYLSDGLQRLQMGLPELWR